MMYPVFVCMNAFIKKKQQRAADWLQQHTRHYSKRTQLTGLIIFCLLFGGSSVGIVIGVLQGKGQHITVQSISVPAHALDTSRLFKELPVLEQQLQENIQRFKRHMDSLYQYAPAAFDSVMKIRPGLIDSLTLVESIYQQQLKTK